MTGVAMRLLVAALLGAAALTPAQAAPTVNVAAPAIEHGISAGKGRAGIEPVSSPRREKYCKDNETGNSTAAKEKSYKDCLKNWR